MQVRVHSIEVLPVYYQGRERPLVPAVPRDVHTRARDRIADKIIIYGSETCHYNLLHI
jgi:hypothetical protein